MAAREIAPGVTADPDVAFGKPVIAGTRLPVSVLLGYLPTLESFVMVAREYDLSEDQIQDVLRYAHALSEREDRRVQAEPQ